MKRILVVCAANFCRSPVAKYLIDNKFKENVITDSAGINAIVSSSMDERSKNFLESNGLSNLLHNPKQINLSMIKSNDIVFALDHEILFELNKAFPKYSYKFKILNYLNPELSLKDPYRANDYEYNKIMTNIKNVIENLSF